MGTGLEGREILEIGEKGEADLRANIGELDVADHLTEYFHGARPAIAAVADEADGFVVPFAVQEVDRVLERGGRAMIVFGRHEDEGVELLDRSRPGLGVRLAVLTHGCWDRLIEQGQVEILYVDDFELSVASLARDVIDPARDGLRFAS